MNYTEPDWRWAIVLGVTLGDDLLGAVADGPLSAEEVVRKLGPSENRKLFGRMRRSLFFRDLPAIREFGRAMSEDAALFPVNMLVLTPGRTTYNGEEYEDWLLDAGLEGVGFLPVPGRGTHLVFASNPG